MPLGAFWILVQLELPIPNRGEGYLDSPDESLKN